VYLAQEYDAVADGALYLSPRRTRLIAPDLRARMTGYLATAPLAGPGFRTDGVWVWPEALADHVRVQGARPQEQLFEHMREHWFLLPDSVSDEDLAEAARVSQGPVTPDPPSPYVDDRFYLGERPGQSAHPLLLWHFRGEQGNVYERLYTMDGWTRSTRLADKRTRPDRDPWEYREITETAAAAVNTDKCNRNTRAVLTVAEETVPGGRGPRVARVFDGASPAGAPWFSPGRLRIPESSRRRRLANYLSAARLVIRAAGLVTDPMDPERGPVVPLGYRTDGTWVWQEAMAYYVLRHGVAPELELLCHIEARGYRLPDEVSTDVARLAAEQVPAGPRPTPAKQPLTYLRSDLGALFRARDGSVFSTDEYGPDLRWKGSDRFWRSRYGDSDETFATISEREAIEAVDDRWRSGIAVPPID
jgi:hypothetical protein